MHYVLVKSYRYALADYKPVCMYQSRARNFDVPYIIYSKFLKSRARNLQSFQSGP